MKTRYLLILFILTLSAAGTTFAGVDKKKPAQPNGNKAARKLVVVTIDGLRWQEVFTGADQQLINHKDYVKNPGLLTQTFWAETDTERREKLLPFFWHKLIPHGAIVGNRNNGSTMSVANPWYFSYPGYSEIFTGVVDESINSNQKVNNPQVTFVEWLNNKPDYQQKNAVFGSWDVFPYIFNTERSQLHVNAGFSSAHDYSFSQQVQWLNELQQEVPSPWHNVRLDAFTYRFAKDYLKVVKPKLLVIALGETDDFAHDGKYDQYLHAAKRTDKIIEDLWNTLQAMPEYRHNTNLLIITDHGRGGTPDDWQHHASKRSLKGYMKGLKQFPDGIVGSEHIWFAALGPDILVQGEVKTTHELTQQQFAATALRLLGENPTLFNPKAAKEITEVLK